MQTTQSNSTVCSVTTKLEVAVNTGKTLSASAAMLAAPSIPAPEVRTDWTVIAEEDSSFFVPERCSALDDF